MALALVPVALVGVLYFRWQGVTLRPEALRVYTLGDHVIPWRDVASIAVEPVLGRSSSVVREHAGRRTRLRAPTTGPMARDEQFEQKFQTIERWFVTWAHPEAP